MDGCDSSDNHFDLVGNYSHSYDHTRRVDEGYFGSLWLYSMFCSPNMGPLSLSQLGSSTMIRKSLTKRPIVVSLSLMEILLFKGFRLDTGEPTEAPPPLWLMCCLFFCGCKNKVSTQVGTLNLDGNMFCLPLEDRFEKVSLSLADNLEIIGQKRLLRKLVVVMFVSKDAKCVALGSRNGEICVVEVKQIEHKLAYLRNHISFQGVMNLLQEVSELAFAQFNRSVILLAGLQGVGNTTVVTPLQMKFLLFQVTLTCLGELRDAGILFSSGFNETPQVNSELSSLRYSSAPILLMYAGDINSVVHLNFQAWSFLLHLHERGPAKNRVFPNSPSFLRVAHLFALKLILLLLLAMVFGVNSVVLKRVIPATKLVHLKYKNEAVHAISHFAIFCVASVFLYLQLVEEFFPSQILEFMGLYMAKKEIATTWIWLATTRLCLQVWELNLHGMNLITAQMLIGDAFFIRELMIADACDIIASGEIGVRLVGLCGADVSLTNSFSLTHHSPLFWLLIKVMSLQSHTTYTWACYPVASYELMFVLRNITSELSMVYSSSWGFPQPTIADYMIQVFARTVSTCGCCTDMDEIKFMLLVLRVGHKADRLGILPLLYKLVFAMASLGTLVLHVTIVSVILGDYAGRYTTVVICMVTTPCFAELVMGSP